MGRYFFYFQETCKGGDEMEDRKGKENTSCPLTIVVSAYICN